MGGIFKKKKRQKIHISYHACCGKRRVKRDEKSSRRFDHQHQMEPPMGWDVVAHGSPAHPAAVLPGLTSQAPAGSTSAAQKTRGCKEVCVTFSTKLLWNRMQGLKMWNMYLWAVSFWVWGMLLVYSWFAGGTAAAPHWTLQRVEDVEEVT